jgi:hypothetical protein
MTSFAGLDVSQAKTTICVVDERGGVTWRGSCATAPEAIVQTLARRAASADRARLGAIVADRNRAQKHVAQARIILASAERLNVTEAARRVGVGRPAVWCWQELA